MLGGIVVDFGEKTIDLSVASRVNKLNSLLQRKTHVLISTQVAHLCGILALVHRIGLIAWLHLSAVDDHYVLM